VLVAPAPLVLEHNIKQERVRHLPIVLVAPAPLVLEHNMKQERVRHLPIVLVPPVLLVLDHNIKQERVRDLTIVLVLKMFVLVKTVFKLLELLVRLMVPIFVPRAPVDITKQVIYVLETKLLVA